MIIIKKIHFEISERKVLLRVFDLISVVLALYLIGIIFDFDYFIISKSNFYWVVILGIYINIFGGVFEIYNLQVASNQIKMIKNTVLSSSTTVMCFLLTPFFTPVLPTKRLQIIFFYLAVLLSLLMWRMFYINFLASTRFSKKVIIICDQEHLEDMVLLLENVDPHYKVVGYLNSYSVLDRIPTQEDYVGLIDPDHLETFVTDNSVSEVVIATRNTDGISLDIYRKLICLLERGYVIRENAQVYEDMGQRMPMDYESRDFYRHFPFSRSNQNHFYLHVIKLFDISISIIGLSLGGVLFPLILIGNLLGNRGSIFYTQERVGKNGKVFKILKLRTMIRNAESAGAVFTSSNDSRITHFGKFLRKTRIDEFPQFVNILKGEMSVIGPRPERPLFAQEIADRMPYYETRHVIKPGLTGWAQVNYTYGETIEDSLIKLQYDLYYIKHRSIFLDINIMSKTLSTVLFYRGQ